MAKTPEGSHRQAGGFRNGKPEEGHEQKPENVRAKTKGQQALSSLGGVF